MTARCRTGAAAAVAEVKSTHEVRGDFNLALPHDVLDDASFLDGGLLGRIV